MFIKNLCPTDGLLAEGKTFIRRRINAAEIRKAAFKQSPKRCLAIVQKLIIVSLMGSRRRVANVLANEEKNNVEK